MIRINLIAERKRAPVSRKARLPTGVQDLGQWLLVGLILLGLLGAGGQYLRLRSKINSKDREVAAAQAEADELAPIIAEVENYKNSKADLERKIKIIGNLKANQRGPVRIMDEVSRALPELLWLNRLEARESTITLSGEAFNTNAVANFIENLDQVPEFQEPILKDATQRGQVYNFTITFSYTSQPLGEESAQAAGG